MKHVRQTSAEVGLLNPSRAGFLLIDSSYRPIYASDDALEILLYPEHPANIEALDSFLVDKIRAMFPHPRNAARSVQRREVVSGRRHYFCRAVPVKSRMNHAAASALVLTLERGPMGLSDFARLASQFRLTPRERQASLLLIEGLTSKEIGERMHISANTVKAFLRLVMIKTGASTRSGIVGKILQAR
jgi:DNA-binding CsgD family transcriptional regulator